MSITLGVIGSPNLIDPSGWTAGNGGVGIYGANGDTGEQNRYVGTNPWGQSAMVWQTVPSGNGNADGGWNTSGVPVDPRQTYRFSVWVRRTSATSGGTFYFGLQSSAGGAVELSGKGFQGNPYWDYRGTGALTQNQWYLVVGHCFPYNDTRTLPHPDSGFWTTGGTMVANNAGNIPFDCQWSAGTTTGVHRCYHFYCGDNTTRLEFFWPRIDLVDGTQPTIAQLLATSADALGVQFNDTSVQTTKYGSTNDVGSLMSISQYTNAGSYTWTRPTGCTTIVVRLVGGGGGSAGYTESGGAGGFAEKLIDVRNISSVTVTVGGGGGSVGYYAAAGQGGTTSFGSYCSATGGYGANQNYSHTGGVGGVGAGGNINLYGSGGTGHGNSMGQGAVARGGETFFGGSAGCFRANNGGQFGPGAAPGSGGPGAPTGSGAAGGVGTQGAVIVWEYQ